MDEVFTGVGVSLSNGFFLDALFHQSVWIDFLLCCFYFSAPGVTIATDIICGFPTEEPEVNTVTFLFSVFYGFFTSFYIWLRFILGFRRNIIADSKVQISIALH